MPLLTQYRTFFVSPCGEAAVCDELNAFLKSHRICLRGHGYGRAYSQPEGGQRGLAFLYLGEGNAGP
jgi:hypothetical protein